MGEAGRTAAARGRAALAGGMPRWRLARCLALLVALAAAPAPALLARGASPARGAAPVGSRRAAGERGGGGARDGAAAAGGQILPPRLVVVLLHTPKAGGSTLTMQLKRLEALGVLHYATWACPGWGAVVNAALQAAEGGSALRVAYEAHRTAPLAAPSLGEVARDVARMRERGVRVVVAGLFREPRGYFWSNYFDGHRHSWVRPLTEARALCTTQLPAGQPPPTFFCDKAPWEWSPDNPQAKQLALWASPSQRMPTKAQLAPSGQAGAHGGRAGVGGAGAGAGAYAATSGGGAELNMLAALTQPRYEGPTLDLALSVLELIDVPILVERQDEGLLALAWLAGLPRADVSVPVVNAHLFAQKGGKVEAATFRNTTEADGRLDGWFALDKLLVAAAGNKLDGVLESLGGEAGFNEWLAAYQRNKTVPEGWAARAAPGAQWWPGGLPRAPQLAVCAAEPLGSRAGGAELVRTAGFEPLPPPLNCIATRACPCPQPARRGQAANLFTAICACAEARDPCAQAVERAFRLPRAS